MIDFPAPTGILFSVITFWRKRWYFSGRAAMVVGVPVREAMTTLLASVAESGMWDALELTDDLASVTIHSDTVRPRSAGTRLSARY